MRRKTHRWADRPELLTSIYSPRDKLLKVEWNYAKYEDAVTARPCDPENVVYTALDFCVAVISLRDWTRKQMARDIKSGAKALPPSLASVAAFPAWVVSRVPWQPAIEAIGNTIKHADYQDNGWKNGTAMIASFVPQPLQAEKDQCQDGWDLFAFNAQHSAVLWWDIALCQMPSLQAEPAYIVFGEAVEQWREIIRELGYLEG